MTFALAREGHLVLAVGHIDADVADLTFTTIDPARYRRAEPQKFWQVSDDIVRATRPTTSPPTRWPAVLHPAWSKRAGAASSS